MDYHLCSLLLMSVCVSAISSSTVSPASTAATSQKEILTSHVTKQIPTERKDVPAIVPSTTVVSATGSPSIMNTSSSTEAHQTGSTTKVMSIHSTSSQSSTTSSGSPAVDAFTSTPSPSTSSSSPQLSGETTPALGNTSRDLLLSTSTTPTAQPASSLTMLAFGVMAFILVLIVIMVILVTTVNMRGRCNNKEKGKKSLESVIESSVTTNGEKESIMLVSVRTINTETDTDSPHLSSVHSTIIDNEDLEVCKD